MKVLSLWLIHFVSESECCPDNSWQFWRITAVVVTWAETCAAMLLLSVYTGLVLSCECWQHCADAGHSAPVHPPYWPLRLLTPSTLAPDRQLLPHLFDVNEWIDPGLCPYFEADAIIDSLLSTLLKYRALFLVSWIKISNFAIRSSQKFEMSVHRLLKNAFLTHLPWNRFQLKIIQS